MLYSIYLPKVYTIYALNKLYASTNGIYAI